MTDLSLVPGFFGKLPMRGDFVARRLPPRFVSDWDNWLQRALAKSREQLGGEWVDIYLSSPFWRFGLSAGLCGESAWLGVLMPSVDQVGRYFPLTVAVPVPASESLDSIFVSAVEWSEQVEDLLLTVLEEGADLDEFNRDLQTLHPSFMSVPTFNSSDNHIPVQLKQWLAEHYMSGSSLWSSSGSELVKPSLFSLKGMPETALLLLTGSVATPGSQPTSGRGCSEISYFNLSSFPLETGCRWYSCALSDVGKVRKINEDAFLERPDIGLWAVADGMGGHQAGDVASQKVVVALNEISLSVGNVNNDLSSLLAAVVDSLTVVNAKLVNMARDFSSETIIGSTLVALLAADDQCAAIWSGDSRLYRYRAGTLTQLTRDHSLVNEMIQQGRGSREELEHSNLSNVVTQALGADAELKIEKVMFSVQKNDLFLLCSDGLSGEVSEAEIKRVLAETGFYEMPRLLIDTALNHQARDNITVVVAQWR